MPARTGFDTNNPQSYFDAIQHMLTRKDEASWTAHLHPGSKCFRNASGAATLDGHLSSWRDELKYGYTSPLIKYVDQSCTCEGDSAYCEAKMIRCYPSFARTCRGERHSTLLRELLLLKVFVKCHSDGSFYVMEHSYHRLPVETHQGYSPCSQISQDSWVLQRFTDLREGFFLEVGANHAKELSNTYFLQMGHCWKGICIEPFPQGAEIWETRCRHGSCDLVRKAVGDGSKVTFVAPGHVLGGFLDKVDINRVTQQANSEQVQVDTQPLQEMLLSAKNQPPVVNGVQVIHYLSLDTEGTEYDILLQVLARATSDRFKVLSISVEHNYKGCSQDGFCAGNHYDASRNGPDLRTAIRKLLEDNGYVLDLEVQHDDFYLLKGYESYLDDSSGRRLPQPLPQTFSR